MALINTAGIYLTAVMNRRQQQRGRADLLIVGNDSNIVNTLVCKLLHLLNKAWDVAGAAHRGVGSWHTH